MISIINSSIDSFQSSKISFVETVVSNEEIKKSLLTYIDAQTAFAKKVAAEASNFAATVGTAMLKFDISKAFTVK